MTLNDTKLNIQNEYLGKFKTRKSWKMLMDFFKHTHKSFAHSVSILIGQEEQSICI